MNLILNARDALTEVKGPVIRVQTAHVGHSIELAVSDNGAGMPPEVLRRIYDPFFTTKAQPREGQRKGTGLGLAVSYGIVQEHNGSIDASSEVGEGTSFLLRFPALEAARASAAETPALATSADAATAPVGDAQTPESAIPQGTVVHA